MRTSGVPGAGGKSRLPGDKRNWKGSEFLSMTEAMVAAENKAAGVNSGSAPRSGALRCAFIHAPDPVYSDTQNYGAKFMPVWAYTLASHVPDDGRFTKKPRNLYYACKGLGLALTRLPRGGF